MKSCHLVLLLFLFAGLPLDAEAQKPKLPRGTEAGISNLIGDFSKKFVSSAGSDSIAGTFYYINSRKIFFEIQYPLHQIMVIEKNITEIYYPEDAKAFRLESANPVVFPLISGLLSAIRPDNGLSLIGFTLSDQVVRNDTFVTYWSYPKSPRPFGWFELAQYNNRLAYSTFHAPDSVSYTTTTFSRYTPPQKGVSLPLEINTIIALGGGFSRERVTLRDLRINSAIPERVANFTIPGHIKVVKKKW
jgi:outer membrane lipoprotein-sorting protein